MLITRLRVVTRVAALLCLYLKTALAALQKRKQGDAAKGHLYPQGRVAEQGMIDAIQSRLHTPPPPEAGLLSIAAARSAATAATNPQMPVADTNDPEVHTSTKEEAPAIEIFLAEADDQSGPG